MDKSLRAIYTYVDTDLNGNDRLQVEILPHQRSTTKILLENSSKHVGNNAEKKIHGYTHAASVEMKSLL